MPQRLMLEGFSITPHAHIVDFEESSIEPLQLGEQRIKLADLKTFAEESWPAMWASLQEQFKAQQEAKLSMAEREAVQAPSTSSPKSTSRRKPATASPK